MNSQGRTGIKAGSFRGTLSAEYNDFLSKVPRRLRRNSLSPAGSELRVTGDEQTGRWVYLIRGEDTR